MELKLKKELTRNGLVLPVGTMVDVPEAKVDWLISTGTAEKVKIFVPDSSDEEEPTTPSRKKRGRKNR